MSNQNNSRNYAIGLTVLSALGRLVPHAPNVTPLGGSCLFAGSRIAGPLAYALPLVVMLATDPIVGAAAGGHSGYTSTSPVIYASFLISVWIGRRVVSNVTGMRVGLAAFLCSLQFFLLTNFAMWFSASRSAVPFYTPNFAGLVSCYAAALPFWGRTLAGDLFFSAALFGMYAWLSQRVATAENRVAV